MTAPRKIDEVIKRILAVVPEGETELRAGLKKVAEKSWFTAPEAMGVCWRYLSLVLSDAIPEGTTVEWQVKVGRIIRGEE